MTDFQNASTHMLEDELVLLEKTLMARVGSPEDKREARARAALLRGELAVREAQEANRLPADDERASQRGIGKHALELNVSQLFLDRVAQLALAEEELVVTLCLRAIQKECDRLERRHMEEGGERRESLLAFKKKKAKARARKR